jgi:hypothetical protein
MDDQIYKGDDGTAIRFYYGPIKNNFQSECHGRAIFDKILYADVMTPGSNESSPTFEIERTYCEEAKAQPERSPKYAQYEKQVEAFKSQSGEHLSGGTPLEQWPQVDVAQVATMKALGIHTVEMLAGVSDNALQNIGMGGRVLRDQAVAYMNTRQFGMPTAQMAAETTHLREEVERLQGEVVDLAGRLEVALQSNSKPAGNAGETKAKKDPLAPTPPATI